MKTYRIVPVDVREMVSGMSTSQLVKTIALHAARVEMARVSVGPVPSLEERQIAEEACVVLDARLPG